MSCRRMLIAAVVAVLLAACTEPLGESTSAPPGDSSSTSASAESSAPSTSVTVGSSTTTSAPWDRPNLVPVVRPEVARSEMEAASSAFVDAGGESVALVTRDGDYVIVDTASGEAVHVYDARALRLRTTWGTIRDGRISRDDGGTNRQTAVQALVASGLEDGSAEIVEVGGRRAAQVAYRLDDWFEAIHVVEDHVVAVDLETGLIVRDAVEDLSPGADPGDPTPAVDGPVTTGLTAVEADFAVSDGGPRYFDDGYRLVGSVAAAEALAGYRIPVPGWLPDGYVLTQVAHGEDSGWIPYGRNVVVLTYRNWSWRIDVTICDLREGRDPTDPFETDELREPRTLANGFEVLEADGFFPQTPAYAWGVVGAQQMTISGGLGPETLVRIVESLPTVGN